ncbi:MAG TPA: hypothetical protein VMA72_13620 [Streptosporangiaceae bacterium]|nr:hypothetical protein [Streptosporangiaceae bacterium]
MRVHLTRLSRSLAGTAVIALLTGLCAASVGPAAASARPAATARSGWVSAKTIPHLNALAVGGDATASAVDCSSAGNCVAGGFYIDSAPHDQAWLAVQHDGKWGNAFEVPGTASLNGGGDASVVSVSCPSAGNCAATGGYEASSGALDVWVASQRHGRWAKATAVRNYPSLNVGHDGEVEAISCSAAGDCTLGGDYLDVNDHFQAFLATEKGGRWAKAEQVPGIGSLNAGGHSNVEAVSCRQVGYCTAAGSTQRSAGVYTAFVISESKGKWGKAARLPNMQNLNKDGSADASEVSCSSAGNCVTGGIYKDSNGYYQAYLDVQKSGKWSNAFEVPGTAGLNKGHNAQVTAISCPTGGNCSVGGYYTNSSGHGELFLVNRSNGSWGRANEIPGLAALTMGSTAQIYSISCSSAGNCSGGGYGETSSFREIAFVVTESGGHWGSAQLVPGITSLSSAGDSGLNQISCRTAGRCTAVGYGDNSSHHGIGWAATRT